MDASVEEKIRQIKKEFRLVMNGPASQSMREKGLDYRVNWGVPFVQLRHMASTMGQDYELAVAMWKENVRECKILATLMMPPEKMCEDIAEIWMDQIHTQELAELLAFNLLQHVSFAPEIAFKWMASHENMRQICAYDLIGRLFMKGQEPNERGIHEFLDQACAALQSESVGVRHAAMNAVTRFAGMGVVYERMAKDNLKRLGIDF